VDVIEGKAIAPINIELTKQPQALIGVSAEGTAGTFVQPSFDGVAGRGVAGSFIPDNQSVEVAAQIAARSRNLGAALGLNGTEVVIRSTEAQASAIAVDPTQYPPNPSSGTIVVQNFISVNVAGEEFQRLSESLAGLVTELRKSNEIAGEVRDKLLAEMEAGMAILRSPKPDPKLVDLLLKRPLTYVADKAVGTVVSTLAATALMALLKIMGLL
jgi:hypothetical protein